MSDKAWISGPLSPETRVLLEADGWVCREMAPGWWEARPKAEWEAMDIDELRDLTTPAEMRRVARDDGRLVVVSLPPGGDWLGDARPVRLESVRIGALDEHRARWARASRDDRAAVLGLLRFEAANPMDALNEPHIEALRAAIAVLQSLEPAGDAAGKDATP